MDLQIAHVILWTNGMVTVCDRDGEQMPEYQGRHADVVEAILKAAPPSTVFERGRWRPRLMCPMMRDEFRHVPVSC